jgi:hypothetical protein
VISPLSNEVSTVSVKELIETILEKNRSSTDAKVKQPSPSKAFSSNNRRNSIPRPNPIGPLLEIGRVMGLD